VATIIRRVLDWQLDLLDPKQLQCIHFTIHCCSCNSSLKAAARPEYSLSKPHPRTPSAATWLSIYSLGADHKENTSPIPLLLEWRHYRNGPQRKRWSLPLLPCVATAVNNRLTVWLLTYSVHVTIYYHLFIFHIFLINFVFSLPAFYLLFVLLLLFC
jgi:hypothetical protein